MYISGFEVHNYKSYSESGRLTLTPGFNIITGQNNAGKTALLEALSLSFSSKPHRSIKSLPTSTTRIEQASTVDFTLSIEREELMGVLADHPGGFTVAALPTTMIIGGPPKHDVIAHKSFSYGSGIEEERRIFVQWVLSQQEYKFNFRVREGQALESPTYPPFDLYKGENKENSYSYISCEIGPDGTIKIKGAGASSTYQGEMGFIVGQEFRNRIYSFRAERMNVGVGSFGNQAILLPDASNLAEVLNIFQANVGRYQRYMRFIQQVLPQVRWVSVRPYPNQKLEIVVWTEDPQLERDDLTVPLSESGTGISQVLAILYVVLTSDTARTILIDEPQSFLHPGAARKLIDILKTYPQHQFIISTHSPTIITAANPQTITLIKQQNAESTFETLNVAETNQLRTYLADIGARLSDVFGADNVLWVEGKTEEICFPMILEKIAGRALMGTAIVGVQHTGDLEGKHAERVFDIYERLTLGCSLLPPAIGFIFDKEGRSEREQEDLKRKSGQRVEFTKRRLYENYLLNAEAITSVLNLHDTSRETGLTKEEVQRWLDDKGHDAKYGRGTPAGGAGTEQPWVEYVHGARVLADLFADLSQGRVAYDKVVHSIQLTGWLIEFSSEDLRELSDLIQGVLDKNTPRNSHLSGGP